MLLPLDAKPYTNVEKLGNQGISEFIDCYKDDGGIPVARPGLGGPTSDRFVDLGTLSVNSLFEWETQGVAVAVADGGIYKITEAGVVTQITGVSLGALPVSFVDFGDTLYLANGGKIVKWAFADSTAAFLADVDAPTQVTHLASLDQRLLAREEDNWLSSEAGDPTDWRGIEYTPEEKPDQLVGLAADWEEVALFGSRTVEFWTGTGLAADPFERLSGTTVEHGTIAPYSISMFDQSYWFIDFMRRIIRLAVRNPQIVSNPFDADFQAIADITDCRSLHFPLDTTVVFTFPVEDLSYAYDYKRDVWGKWSYLRNGERERYLGNCACYMRAWNKQLVGSRNNGKIFFAGREYTSDGGAELMPLIRTGSLNFGTQNWKYPMGPNAMLLKVKRGQVLNPTVEPFLQIRYKKENDQWSNVKTINLGRGGEMNTIGKVRTISRFRNIEFEFVWDAASMTAIISADLNI